MKAMLRFFTCSIAVIACAIASRAADDPELGDHLWTFDPGLSSTSADFFTEPAIGPDGTIYVAHTPSLNAPSGMLFAINPDGTERWSKSLAFDLTYERLMLGFSLPSIAPDGTVYIAAGRKLYSFTPDGVENWQRSFASSNPWNYAPLIYPLGISEDGRLYLPVDNIALHEIDPVDGSTLWTFASEDPHVFSFTRPITITLSGDLLLPFWSGEFFSLSKDGDVYSRGISADDPSGSSCMSIDAAGKIFATQGYLHREQTVRVFSAFGQRATDVSTIKGVTTPPLIGANGELYFSDRYGNLHCLNAGLTVNWTLTGYADQEPILAQDGTLFAVTADAASPDIRALDPAGQVLYEMTDVIGDVGAAAPTYEYPHSSAQPLARLALSRDGMLIAASQNGKIYAFHGTSPLSRSAWPKAYGGYENASRLTHFAPEITQQPTGGEVITGEGNTLEIAFAARPEPSVQWYRNGTPVGTNSPTLDLASLGAEQGEYYAIIENPLGSVQSETVTVEVKHRLVLLAAVGGAIAADPVGPLYDDGVIVTLAPIPDEGYAFDKWLIDLDGSTAPLLLTMDYSKTVGAVFDDIAPPSLVIDGEFPTTVALEPRITLTGSATDNAFISTLRMSVNGGDFQHVSLGDGTFEAVANLELGENTITLRATDNSELVSEQTVMVTWDPAHRWGFDVSPEADEADIIRARVVLTSPGDVAGANISIAANSTYLSFVSFTPSLELLGMFQTQSVQGGTLNFTFASVGNTIRAGDRVIGTVRYRVRSLAGPRTETLTLNQIDLASGDGSPLPGISGITNGEILLTPREIVGDVNNNGRYDAGDAQHLQRLLGGLEPFRPWDHPLNDVNQSGGLDIGDVIAVLRTVARLEDQPGDNNRDRARRGASPRITTSFDQTAPTARLILDKVSANAGETVTVQVLLENVPSEFGGTSYVLDYPVEALRLESSDSYSSSPLQPANTLQLWNLEPSQNDFANQTGTISFAAGSAESWPGSDNGGLIAEFTFTVQAGAASAAVWPIELREMEIATDSGLTVVPTNSASALFIGQAITSNAWRTANFDAEELADLTVSTWGADPDLDGRDNLGEYFAGSNPRVADVGSIACPVLVETPDGEIHFGIQIDYDPRAIDVAAMPQLSADLRSWLDGDGLTEEVESTGQPADGLQRKTIIDLRPIEEQMATPFMRLSLAL